MEKSTKKSSTTSSHRTCWRLWPLRRQMAWTQRRTAVHQKPSQKLEPSLVLEQTTTTLPRRPPWFLSFQQCISVRLSNPKISKKRIGPSPQQLIHQIYHLKITL